MNSKSGQTLFELVVAIAVAVLVVVGIVTVVIISLRNANFARDQARATRYGQEAAEWLRSERDKGWSTFSSRSGQTWCLKTLAWDSPGVCSSSDFIPNTYFQRWVQLTTVSSDSTNVSIKVSWKDGQGVHESKIDTVLNNTRAGGGTEDDD